MMLTKDIFTTENFNPGLIFAVGNRLQTGEYTDAILAGMKCLTDVLRAKGGIEGDGAQLVGQVLGGSAPTLRLNKLQTVSEKDEQKGIEQLVRGLYVGVRNPRTHEITEDTEDFCIRTLIIVDVILQYLNRNVEEFNVQDFVNRIYDPYFVPSQEYAQALVSQVPADKVMEIFSATFARRDEGKLRDVQFAFEALYQIMPDDDLSLAVNAIGNALRTEQDASKIADLFQLLKPSAWSLLDMDVQIRMENLIIEECGQGTYDVYASFTKKALGSWGNTFGRYFDRRDDLANCLIGRLGRDWYSQNYVGQYFMYALPVIITGAELIKQTADILSYAAVGNKAKVIRHKLLEVAPNYPPEWKEQLKVSIQERKESDADYADQILSLLD